MEPDRVREIAVEEVDAAFVRFLARAGERPGIHEFFAWAAAGWVYAWTSSYLLPDEPADPDEERRLQDEVARARRDMELRQPHEGTDDA